MTTISLNVNGQSVTTEVEPRQHLADFLREYELLTGTRLGCEHGVCGACTVLIDGAPARSCIAYPAALDGAEIMTIEAFEDDEVMARLREAFSAEHALQCGYCTPGMLVMARDIVLRLSGAGAATIRAELAGNLCRCTGYVGIVRAIERVIAARGEVEPLVRRRAVPLTNPVAVTTTAEAAKEFTARVGEPRIEAGEEGETRISQSFTVGFSRGAVWAFFQDTKKAIECMPGAELGQLRPDGTFTGQMHIKLGPLGARISGEGKIAQDPKTFTGSISGHGTDRNSSSRVRGRVDYKLSQAGPDETRVDVTVGYAVVGPLAQIARGGIVRDLAARLTSDYIANLEARIAGREAVPGSGELRAGTLLLSVLRYWLRRLFKRDR